MVHYTAIQWNTVSLNMDKFHTHDFGQKEPDMEENILHSSVSVRFKDE